MNIQAGYRKLSFQIMEAGVGWQLTAMTAMHGPLQLEMPTENLVAVAPKSVNYPEITVTSFSRQGNWVTTPITKEVAPGQWMSLNGFMTQDLIFEDRVNYMGLRISKPYPLLILDVNFWLMETAKPTTLWKGIVSPEWHGKTLEDVAGLAKYVTSGAEVNQSSISQYTTATDKDMVFVLAWANLSL